jgi:serine protease Do
MNTPRLVPAPTDPTARTRAARAGRTAPRATWALAGALALGAAAGRPAQAQPADAFLASNLVADVAERVTPAVVNITTERTRRGPGNDNPLFGPFGPFGPQPQGPRGRETGAGSGVVISSDGYIVTNNHVVADADTVKVTFTDKRELKAKVIGTDAPADLALLKVEATGLTKLELGDSNKLRIGEFVLAVGNPFGVGQTVTMGIVSAKGKANMGIVDYEDFIQTDAAINPGNSGGALVNLRGELIGINTAILSRSGSAAGVGFAVPTTMVRPILDQIRQHGRVKRGWLGVGIQDLNADLAQSLDLAKDLTGVVVSDVMPDGPAGKADIKSGDVIVAVNGKKMTSSAELRNYIALLGPSQKANVDLVRDGKKRSVSLTLGEKKDTQQANEPVESKDSVLSGLQLRNLTPDVRQRFRVSREIDGVMVVDVAAGSPAQEAGVQEGDIITQIDRKGVESVEQLSAMSLDRRDRVLLRVYRRTPAGMQNLFLVVRRGG